MSKPFSIIVLGGGTAGWMAANLMAKRWRSRNVEITVIESPQIGIVGVGEGSTPQLKAFFDQMGVAESQWMPECNATYKTGITFKAWSAIPGFEEYFHPFPARTDRDTAQAFVYNCFLRRDYADVDVSPDTYFLPAYLAAQKLGPIAADNFPFPVTYGYHVDAHLVGKFLCRLAEGLGVKQVQEKIVDVRRDERGDIAALIADNEVEYHADFFIDASGFNSVLLQKSLQVEFVSFKDNLYNDRAVVLPTPNDDSVNSQTIATAMSCGWRWDIPLTERTGNGYVYSSDYCNADAAEEELRRSLGMLDSEVTARHLKMRVGQVKQHWKNNCLAVGLSQGFIEPLEATALHLVQETVQRFIQLFEKGDFQSTHQREFNQIIGARFDGIRDYIVCHYKVNSRDDSDYWVANRENLNLSDSLQSVLEVWQSGEDLAIEIERQGIADYYSTLSWHCLLAGYGIFPHDRPLIGDDQRAVRFDVDGVRDFNRRCALNFAPHTTQLLALQGSRGRSSVFP